MNLLWPTPPRGHSIFLKKRVHLVLLLVQLFGQNINITFFSSSDKFEKAELRRPIRPFMYQSKHKSLDPRRFEIPVGSCNSINLDGHLEEPPPLPMKKKHSK